MTGRRSSARLAAQSQTSSSPPQPNPSPAGKKRKNEATGSSPSAKREKKDVEPKQKTLQETFQNGHSKHPAPEKPDEDGPEQEKTKEPPAQEINDVTTDSKKGDDAAKQEDTDMTGTDAETKGEDAKEKADDEGSENKQPETNGTDTNDDKQEETKTDANGTGTNATKQEEAKNETKDDAVIPNAREASHPSSILEKGIIYFFFRARVNVDNPQDVQDIARSYMIMRPIPLDAKLGDGPIGDVGNCRLLALPKKVLPKSGKDRFMTFVEKAKTTFSDLKDSFMTGSDYATKTAGTSHTPPATPLAEGVYAITSTGRESHLAYIITIPSELGEVQKDIGLNERGSFVASVKNPTQPAPSNTSLPQGPDYPQEILDEFRSLRWKPLEPKHLDYAKTQFLIIGETFDHAVEQRPKDKREGNAPPEEEIEKLEGEDEIRVKHLKGDDSVFVDLGITSKDFPKVLTTW